MRVNFSFRTRQGMQVAMAIVEEIYGVRSELLSIQGDTFRFQGGMVVKPNLVELFQFKLSRQNSRKKEWVVTNATVRFYELDKNHSRISDQKVEQIWDHNKLFALKNSRWWYYPRVQDINSIEGRVGIFWNNIFKDGMALVYPYCNQKEGYSLIDEISYRRFVPGDKERAKETAWGRIRRKL